MIFYKIILLKLIKSNKYQSVITNSKIIIEKFLVIH